jgi:hypothetical protein
MMPCINFRVPPELLAEATRLAEAEGLSVGEWTRKLVEEATGMTVEVKMGLAGASERTRKRVQRLGVKAIKDRLKEAADGKK